ncbi:MAG: hypothetical protein DRH30_02795, partial [Deltaproteobacteria bacterium]
MGLRTIRPSPAACHLARARGRARTRVDPVHHPPRSRLTHRRHLIVPRTRGRLTGPPSAPPALQLPVTTAQPAVCDVPPRQSRPSVSRCVHCAQPLVNDAFAPYCCRGCRAVHGILTKAGLTRYYDLRRGPGLPPADLESRRI